MASPVFMEAAGQRANQAKTLEEGRLIYLTNCAKCHSVEPIGRYTSRHWREIMPRMAEITNLDDRQTEAVTSYVLSARKVLEQTAVVKKSQ